MSSPSPLFQTVLSVFTEAGWAYQRVGDREVIRCGFEAHHARVDLHVQVFASLGAVSVVVESNRHDADPMRRERLAELAMRVNQTLTVGNFELDWDAGRLFFRVTNLFPTAVGEPGMIRALVQTAVLEMDRVSPVEAILFRSQGPALAALDLPELLDREDLMPPIPEADSAN